MPSPALDDFNAYIAARKAAVDAYVVTKKAQVDTENVARKAAIDAGAGNAAGKNSAKAQLDIFATNVKALFDTTAADTKSQILDVFVAKGEDYYVRVLKEGGKHLRKHIAASKASGSDAATCDLLDAIAVSLDAEEANFIIAYAKAFS